MAKARWIIGSGIAAVVLAGAALLAVGRESAEEARDRVAIERILDSHGMSADCMVQFINQKTQEFREKYGHSPGRTFQQRVQDQLYDVERRGRNWVKGY